METGNPEKALQERLAEKLEGLFDYIIEERRRHYQEDRGSIPTVAEVGSLVSAGANKNAVLSGSVSLVPGPLGMLATLPEIMVIVRNQIALIYDIGMAHGKEKVLTRELLVGILLTAFGAQGISFLTVTGGKVLVKRSSLRIFQKIIAKLGGKVSQRLLKSMISKWLPLLGAAAMAAWTRHETQQVGKKAIEIFSQDIEVDAEVLDAEAEAPAAPVPQQAQERIEAQRVLCLINLMKIDHQIRDAEVGYIEEAIGKLAIGPELADQLRDEMRRDGRGPIDYALFRGSPDDSMGLIVDLVALAKRDGSFHVSERMYIQEVSKHLGYAPGDVDALMAAD